MRCRLRTFTHYNTAFTWEPRVWCDCCGRAIIETGPDDLADHAESCECTNPTHQETR